MITHTIVYLIKLKGTTDKLYNKPKNLTLPNRDIIIYPKTIFDSIQNNSRKCTGPKQLAMEPRCDRSFVQICWT